MSDIKITIKAQELKDVELGNDTTKSTIKITEEIKDLAIKGENDEKLTDKIQDKTKIITAADTDGTAPANDETKFISG